MMHPALPFSRVERHASPPIVGALAVVGLIVAAFPATGHHLVRATPILQEWLAPLRLALLVAAYGVVAMAAYRHTANGGASGAALLWAAALGWGGWEWNVASAGWLAFAALVFMLEQRSRRGDVSAALLVVGWAALDASAAWGGLLVGVYALARWRDRPLVALLGAVVAGLVLEVRGVDLRATLFPAARPWVWVDGQAANRLGDPIGLALFGGMVLVIVLRRMGAGTNRVHLLPLAVFAVLTWQSRRNGIWLGFVAAPALGMLLADLEPRGRRWASAGVALGGLAMLGLALLNGPNVIAGRSLTPQILAALPDGPLMYRPDFEPSLLRARPPATLLLNTTDPDAVSTAWKRIATNCAPADELALLRASGIVLDSHLDAAPIAALRSSPRWRQVAADETATVFARAPARP